MTLLDGLKKKTKSELDETLESAIALKLIISNKKTRVSNQLEDSTKTTSEKEQLDTKLLEVQKRLESKQNEIDLIRTVSQDKIRATVTSTSSTKSSNLVTPPKPKIGGLIDTRDGKEAWTGGKPSFAWTHLDPSAPKIPIPTQLRSNNSKAAVAMIKRTQGLYNEESAKFKHNRDLYFFCKLFEKHLQKHGLDSVAYRRCPTGNREMMSLFTNYPKFSLEGIKDQNDNIFSGMYDEYDKQNDIEATECLLNSLDSELCKDIMA